MSGKLTLQQIKSIKDAKLVDDSYVEFLLHFKRGRKRTWIQHNRISSNTLRSNTFRKFYKTIDSKANNISDLINYLRLQSNEQETTDSENESDSGNENDTQINKNTVMLAIGHNTQTFKIDSLRSLSYFNAMFSQRWMNNRNDNSNSNNIVKIFDTIPERGAFGFEDLELLLKCVEIGKIPNGLMPDINILDGLINCNDYLTDKNDSIINETTLIEYFKNLKPRLNFQQRKRLTYRANNELLKTALIKYNTELTNKMNEMRNDLASNMTDLKTLNRIYFDSETANVLFSKKYKIISQFTDENETKLNIEITNFTTFAEFQALYRCCDLDQNLSLITASQLPDLIIKLNKDDSNKQITSTDDTIAVIQVMLQRLIGHFFFNPTVGNSCDLSKLGNDSYNIDIVALFEVQWRIPHEYGSNSYLLNVKGYMADVFRLSDTNLAKFVSFMLDKLKEYSTHYGLCTDEDSQDRPDLESEFERRKTAKKNLVDFVQECMACVVSSNDKLLVDKADKWFPIFHENFNQSCIWIMNTIVSQMSTQSAFDFGIYLTKYITYHMKSNQQFPQIYLNFLRNELGITWQIQSGW